MKSARLDNHNHNPFSLSLKHNQTFVKFMGCFLAFALVYHFYFPSIALFSPVLNSETKFLETLSPLPSPVVAQAPEIADFPAVNGAQLSSLKSNESRASQNEKCDIFKGEWIQDPNGPSYTNKSCHSIEDHQNCMRNGRPDSGYMYWRWRPWDCELPKFNPKKFLKLMRNKSMAFIGDSIYRNHIQSLLCILSEVEEAVTVYHDKEYKSRRWYFPSYDFTLSVIWSPFLVKAAIFEDINGVSSDIAKVNLDKLDPKWIEHYKDFDYIEIGGGKWFLKAAVYYENNTIIGCHGCPEQNITKVAFEYAYGKAINATLKFITSSKHKPITLFRTSTPDHFENGEWNTGGYCNRTMPFKEGEVHLADVDMAMQKIELEEFKKAVAFGPHTELHLKLFDTTHLSLLRPDGHPGPYRAYHPFSGKHKGAKVQLDCLHWCLPGPIDTWNDLMMEMLIKG